MKIKYVYNCKLRSVYDGDTIRLDIDLGFDVWHLNQPIRLLGIDTPELKGQEREQGLESKIALLSQLAVGEDCQLQTFRPLKGKYGRYLGVVYNKDGLNINRWLYENSYAKRY